MANTPSHQPEAVIASLNDYANSLPSGTTQEIIFQTANNLALDKYINDSLPYDEPFIVRTETSRNQDTRTTLAIFKALYLCGILVFADRSKAKGIDSIFIDTDEPFWKPTSENARELILPTNPQIRIKGYKQVRMMTNNFTANPSEIKFFDLRLFTQPFIEDKERAASVYDIRLTGGEARELLLESLTQGGSKAKKPHHNASGDTGFGQKYIVHQESADGLRQINAKRREEEFKNDKSKSGHSGSSRQTLLQQIEGLEDGREKSSLMRRARVAPLINQYLLKK